MRSQLELYGTLGPADHDKKILKDMFRNGMTGLRLNLSHKSLAECEDWLSALYEVSEELHIVPDLLVDLQGPELRIGELPEPLHLKAGETVLLGASVSMQTEILDETPDGLTNASKRIPGKLTGILERTDRIAQKGAISVPSPVLPLLKTGQQILLDDGKILLEVTESGDHPDGSGNFTARVLTGGVLVGRKSLALPGQTVNLPTLTKKDMENLSMLSRYRVTGVMLPFVRNDQDLITLKKALLSTGNSHVRIFAKIENQAGVNQLPSLLPHCDHVVIARGDLANSVSMTKLPGVQKKIARLCLRTKTPFMVVTQMLASMEHSPVPTRAEVSDIFNAVLDGASSLMLTGETAVGEYPVEAIKVLSDVSFEALRYKMECKFSESEILQRP